MMVKWKIRTVQDKILVMESTGTLRDSRKALANIKSDGVLLFSPDNLVNLSHVLTIDLEEVKEIL